MHYFDGIHLICGMHMSVCVCVCVCACLSNPSYEQPPGIHNHFSIQWPLSYAIWSVANNQLADANNIPQIMTKLPLSSCYKQPDPKQTNHTTRWRHCSQETKTYLSTQWPHICDKRDCLMANQMKTVLFNTFSVVLELENI